jgi:hypothetical protein
MAYTRKTPVLISANMLHFGQMSGSNELMIPKGWNKLIIRTNKNEKIVVNCGTVSNYSVGGGVAPDTVISVPTDYQIIPDRLFITLASSTLVSVEVLENKGVVDSEYYEKMNKYLYSETMETTVSATPAVGTFPADGTTRFSFSVPDGYLAYQWQVSADDGETWNNSTSDGAQTRTISGVMQAGFSGRLFRCLVTNNFEQVKTSNSCLLQVATENNAKTPTVEDLEKDENVIKIDVDKDEAKEIFENLEKEGEKDE